MAFSKHRSMRGIEGEVLGYEPNPEYEKEFITSHGNAPIALNRIGILGAGRAGTALARACLNRGVIVNIASTRPPAAMKYHLAQYAPGATAVHAEEIAHDVDAVVLAVPQEDLGEVDPEWLWPEPSGVTGDDFDFEVDDEFLASFEYDIVRIDMTNRWNNEPIPGWLQANLSEGLSSTEAIARKFGPLTKAFNAISHWDLDSGKDHSRRVIGVASDNPDHLEWVCQLVGYLDFTPGALHKLEFGAALEPHGPIFNRVLDEDSFDAAFAEWAQQYRENS